MDVLNIENEDLPIEFDNIISELGEEKHKMILNLLEMGKTAEEISSFLTIDIDTINTITNQ